MNFEEFLIQTGDDLLVNAYYEGIKQKSLLPAVHNKLWSLLKEYYITGGMPKAVYAFFQNIEKKIEAYKAVRQIQKGLVTGYINDFSKHSGKTNALHIARIFENIPMQLSGYMDGSTKRYRFRNVITGKKSYGELQGPIDWLIKAGLAIKVHICKKAEMPFKSFCKDNIFKLFMFDTGLLGAMLELSPEILLLQDYGITKGFFAENFTACEILSSEESQLYSWTERNSEIEFIMEINGRIVPVEVKSGRRTKAKSLSQYMLKYHPKAAIKISANSLKMKNAGISQVPLYLSGKIKELL